MNTREVIALFSMAEKILLVYNTLTKYEKALLEKAFENLDSFAQDVLMFSHSEVFKHLEIKTHWGSLHDRA